MFALRPITRPPLLLILLSYLLLPIPTPAWAQDQAAESDTDADTGIGSISGTVVAESTGQALAGASVVVLESGDGDITDEAGNFRIADLAPGEYTLDISLVGYLSTQSKVAVTAGQTHESLWQLADDPSLSEVIVIVGSRSQRTVTQTPVPIDVITADMIQDSGQSETNQILAAVAPSYNATHQTIADGSDHVNPASLRGLGPGQALVLVNGKRRHPTALMHVNGTFGRGAVSVDLNAIPATAIKRVEVLRDGASAQYGSDAIAGVINIVLKDYSDLAEFIAQTGITAFGDGLEIKTGANLGTRLGKDGVLNVAAEILQRSHTDRSGPWTGAFFPEYPNGGDPNHPDYAATDEELARQGLSRDAVSMRIGQSDAIVGSLMYNAEYPLGRNGAVELYSFGGFTYRDGASAGFYRRPNEPTRSVRDIHPNGFLPEIHTDVYDWSAAVGARVAAGLWSLDVSANHGGSVFGFDVENSVNTSFGSDSPTSFDCGSLMFSHTMLNADVVRPLELAGIKRLSLVGGAEARLENYGISAGEPLSYEFGGERTADGTPKVPGAQVLPGFQPENAVDENRTVAGAYVGVESEINDLVLVDIAGRFENYSDFGATVNGKLAARVSPVEMVALRGAVSTGYRAPALHQIYYNTTSTQTVEDPDTGMLIPQQVLTASNVSELAKAFGIPSLDEETSLNLSAGFTARPLQTLTITADVYRITIDDRVVLTGRFTDAIPGVTDLLMPFPGVTQAQFFANAVDTETIGADLVVDYRFHLDNATLDVTGSANMTRTEVEEINVPQSFADNFADGDIDAVRDVIFNREEEGRLEVAVPRQKGALSLRYRRNRIGTLLRANYYGAVDYIATNPDLDENFSAKVTVDAEASYQHRSGFKLAIGANNLLNTMPDQQEKAANVFNEQFRYSRRVSQYGIKGGFYYLKLQYIQ